MILALVQITAVFAQEGSVPKNTVMWDGASLIQSKSSLADPSSDLQPSLKNLVAYANHWRNESIHGNTFSVMSKLEAGPSGDKHDFYSLGTYWWPNPNTSTGLPYIRKDGFVNPETFKYDSVPISQMIFAVSNLSLAYYFTEDATYCAAAVNFIDAWFLDEATKMNPDSGLQYAQLLRGIDEGRGIGIIDAKDLAFVPDSALLLNGCNAWTNSKQENLQAWFSAYLKWLLNSAHGADEFARKNNHGTWFDEQALTLSLHVGNDISSQLFANNALSRVDVQIKANGTLPFELSRTRSMHYTWWDLLAFFQLAHATQRVGVDLFHYTSILSGGSLKGALDFVAPYAVNSSKEPWPYQETTPFDHGKFFQILRMASQVYNDSAYESMIPQLPGCVDYESSVINLLWPSKTREQ